jgi:serine/threonine-protein kinase
MAQPFYQPLGPLLSGEGSRAFLGLEVSEGSPPRPVVLVWVPEELAKDPEAFAKIARETKRASMLEHPNIIKVYGLASLDEGLARVVEFADGESLRKVLSVVKKFPPRLAALATADAAMGTHYAHVAGNEDGTPLLHGDIRPETLMVSFSGVCKVTGYGALSVAPKEQGGKRVHGRRAYCAPEQILGGRDAVNRQTDVYLLGLVLYECLTGEIPFKDEPDFDEAVLNRPFPRPAAEDIPPELIRVVEQATAKKAADRFPTARALRDAIERAIGVLPDHEELAAFLRTPFPEDAPARQARARELEAGIAELARKESERTRERSRSAEQAQLQGPAATAVGEPRWAGSSNSKPASLPQPRPGAALPTAGAAEPSAPASERPVARWFAVNPTNERSVATYVVPVLVLLALAGYWYLDHRSDEGPAAVPVAPGQSPAGSIANAPDVPGKPPAAAGPTSGEVADLEARLAKEAAREAASARDSGTATTDETSQPIAAASHNERPEVKAAVAKAPVDASPTAATSGAVASTAGNPALELSVDPPVEVALDGKPVGRSPVTVPVKPGKHVLQLTDPTRGINVSRAVRVAEAGKTSQRVVIGKGVVEVSAPAGAAIFIDGKSVGIAPVEDVSVFEGKHRILATLGSAKWQQAFTVAANERMSFKIEAIDN